MTHSQNSKSKKLRSAFLKNKKLLVYFTAEQKKELCQIGITAQNETDFLSN